MPFLFDNFFFSCYNELGDNVVAEVLVEIVSKQMDATFTYRIPDSLMNQVAVGKRVLVPFGKQKVEGFVLSVSQKEVDFPLKDMEEVVDEEVILNEELLSLGKYISKKTLCSLITAYQAMLPRALKAKYGHTVSKKELSYLSLLDISYVPKTQKQKEVIDIVSAVSVL